MPEAQNQAVVDLRFGVVGRLRAGERVDMRVELFKALLHKLITGEINIKSLNLDLSSVRRGTLNAGNCPQFLSSYD